MKKLNSLFHAIFETQDSLLDVTTAIALENVQKRESHDNQIADLTHKIYDRCSNC